MFYSIELVQTNIETVSTKFNINAERNIDIKMFYSIESVQTNIGTVSTKFSTKK